MRAHESEPTAAVFGPFQEILDWLPADAIIAVDMPIGLPEQGTKGGREAERSVRPLLRKRRSSVFSIPSRAAVYAEIGPFPKGTYVQAHARASKVARESSPSASSFPIQAFGIFPKIREIDHILRQDPALQQRLHESHPEIAFQALNEGVEMTYKKSTASGQAERCQLLERHGFSAGFLGRRDFSKAARDDFLDACVMLLVAERLRAGAARSYPSPPVRDSSGLPIAIWA